MDDPSPGAAKFYSDPPRLIADGVSVDPLGSCAMGASEFPERFRGLVAMGRVIVTPRTTGRATGAV